MIKQKVWIVHALDYFVQPVGVFFDENHALMAAKAYTKECNTNTEIYGYITGCSDGGFFSLDRVFNKTSKQEVANGKKILSKYFPITHIQYEDFHLGVGFNTLTLPPNLLAVEAAELIKNNFVIENKTICYNFHKRWN